VALFSTNETLEFRNASEAVKSRYAEIPFRKTYSTHPLPGQLRADPKFKEDTRWVIENVCPAFINLLVEELQNVLDKGIDYSATNERMEENKYQTDVIYRYFTDRGIVSIEGGKNSGAYITLSDAWQIYCGGLEKDDITEEDRKRNSKEYCPNKNKFSQWVKTSYKGVESGQIRIGQEKITVLYGLGYVGNLPRHLGNPDTASVSVQAEAKADHRQAQASLDSVPKHDYAVPEDMPKLEPLPDKDACDAYAKIWIAVHPEKSNPDNPDTWLPCKLVRWNNPHFKTSAWVKFNGETQERLIPTSDIEPDPTGEDW
jgi:phage/plasmid-associated DNA primase